LAESGSSTQVMKKHFNWRSEGTCSRYVERTKNSQMDISKVFGQAKCELQKENVESSKVVNF